MVEKELKAFDIDRNIDTYSCKYIEVDTCPRCNVSLRPEILSSYIVKYERWFNGNDSYSLWVVNYCTKCRGCFLTEYREGFFSSSDHKIIFSRFISYPQSFQEPEFSKEINEISNRFIEVYSQAENADISGLNEIAGMGYRKALEVLIIDYCLKKGIATEEELEKFTLGQIINCKIDDNRIKTTANRAAWLGNDHSHYFTKHTDRDIGDLKILIQLTVNWIESVMLTEQYEKEISKK